MRRSFLLASIAAGAVALFTSGTVAVATSRAIKIETFKTKLAELAFCKTGYEIASSHPHYAARFANAKAKSVLIKESDQLNAKKEQLELLIEEHIKEAEDLHLNEQERQTLIDSTTSDAEMDAVKVALELEEPATFLDHINELCEPYLTE